MSDDKLSEIDGQFIALFDSALTGWGETKNGSWIKFKCDHTELNQFRNKDGMTAEVFVRFRDNSGNVVSPYSDAVVAQAEPVPDLKPIKGEHGKYWRTGIQSGMFYDVDLLKRIAQSDRDDEWQDWCRKLPCVVTGGFDDTDRKRNVYAHILTAGGRPSGSTGAGSNKVIYQGLPLQQKYHAIQHESGWLAVYIAYCTARGKTLAFESESDAIDWAMKIRSKNLIQWTGEKLCSYFGVSSRSHISPEMWEKWLQEN